MRGFAGIGWKARVTRMLYQQIKLEVIVVADEAEAVVAELNAALDRIKRSHTFRWWH